jgi:outer membrane protein OmpA-like peptidoglycan-associated protein
MKNTISFNLFAPLMGGVLFFSSCINSKEAYDKSKLSGFVANQTTDLISKNQKTTDNSGIERKLSEVETRVNAIDANNEKAAKLVSELEKKMDDLETLEKESKAEFERSNNAVVFFDLGSSKLTASGMQELYRWKAAIDKNKSAYSFTVNLYSSADKTGNPKFNEQLRTKRADAVKDFLVNVLGVTAPIQVTTSQPSFSIENTVDRRVMVSITINK